MQDVLRKIKKKTRDSYKRKYKTKLMEYKKIINNLKEEAGQREQVI